jgi:hypothetical protein
MERKKLSELQAEVEGLSEGGMSLDVTDGPSGRYLLLKHANGEILCGMSFNDVSNEDGNRFEDDLD